MSYKDRLLLSLRVVSFAALALIVGSGHPPSKAQDVPYHSATTPEDARQDADIDNMRQQYTSQSVYMASMQATIEQQGKDIATFDAKLNTIGFIIGILQAGGIVISLKKGKV